MLSAESSVTKLAYFCDIGVSRTRQSHPFPATNFTDKSSEMGHFLETAIRRNCSAVDWDDGGPGFRLRLHSHHQTHQETFANFRSKREEPTTVPSHLMV